MTKQPIDQISFEAEALLREHPPQWHHRNKETVFEIACSSDAPFDGQITYACWKAEQLPGSVTLNPAFSVRPGHFGYGASEDSTTVDWHLNFSDPYLFVAYGSDLLAQDELQAAEHPILGSIREALLSKGLDPVTVTDREEPTPVTVTGAQRRCVIDTRPNPEMGCPYGLYGNAFAEATTEQVKAATTALSPPTLSNILAIAAPPGGVGEYSRGDMLQVLTTAYTGFLAARAESKRLVPNDSRTVVHTGFWGCGAFGGNRRLMTILQALAADLAGVEIVFWASDESGVSVAEDARKTYESLRNDNPDVSSLLERIAEEKLEWGVSDGN